MALASSGLALGLAALLTLAAWNDSEWVFGGFGPSGDPDDGEGVGTSAFNVQQDAWSDTVPTTTSGAWADFEDNPGDGLIFNVVPTGLTPGDTIYAPVALSTTTETTVDGTLQLSNLVPSADASHVAEDPGGLLWDALVYSVRVTDDSAVAENCRDDFAASGALIVEDLAFDDDLLPATGDTGQDLDAERGNVQYYCFALTLPDTATDVQGRVVYPAWRFHAESN